MLGGGERWMDGDAMADVSTQPQANRRKPVWEAGVARSGISSLLRIPGGDAEQRKRAP